MNAVRVEMTVEADGELHLTELPCKRGDKVEAIVLILEQLSRPGPIAQGEPVRGARLTPAELRRMPREQRQAILAAAAVMAEEDYRSDKELTGFEAFSEEERDDH